MSRVVFRSTGTKEIAAAKRIAAQVIESFWNDAGRGAESLKLRNDNATIGELIDRYEDRAICYAPEQMGNQLCATDRRKHVAGRIFIPGLSPRNRLFLGFRRAGAHSSFKA